MNGIFNFFNTILDSLQNIFGSIPFVLIILGIVIVVLIVGMIVVTVLGMKRASTPKAKVPDSQKSKNDAKTEDEEEDRLPPFLGWIGEFLSKKGFFYVNSLSLSFLKAIDFLEESAGSYNAKYQLPWYLLVGAEGSGKTTLFSTSHTHIPLGKEENEHPHPECHWTFLRQATVLDIRGNLFLDQVPSQTQEKSWRSLLVLLSRYRSARPLNGIILTIPATEIYGKTKLTQEAIHERARFIAGKLSLAQFGLGLRLPVYIIITKTDVVPGFQNFCQELPSSNRSDMLGWSSSFSLSTTYTQKWVDEAFLSLKNALNSLRLEMLVRQTHPASLDGIFVFTKELILMKQSLSLYLNALFKEDGYHEPLLLRGIYFCGDSGKTQMEDEPSSIPTKQSHERNICFFDSILSDKIFLEPGLAIPLKNRLANANRGLMVAKISTAAFVVIGTYGAFHACERFIKNKDRLIPVLGRMNSVLRSLSKIRIDQPLGSGEIFDSYARQLIDMMSQFEEAKFFSIFIPASWFSPLYEDLHKTLRVSYQNIIVRTIYVDLLLKARHLLHLRPRECDKTQELSNLLLPLESAEYLLLKQYIDGLSKLEKHIDQFNRLNQSADPSELASLIAYTFQSKLPEEFWRKYSKFKSLLRHSSFPVIDLLPYKNLAEETLKVLFQNFINTIFTFQNTGSLPYRLQESLQQIQGKNTSLNVGIHTLRTLSAQLSKAKQRLGESGKTWIDGKYFQPGPDYEKLLSEIDYMQLFGRSVTQYLVDQAAIGFFNFRAQLQVLNRILIDPILLLPTGDAQKIFPSQGLLTLEKSLNVLFLEPYMIAPTQNRLMTSIPIGKMVFWDSKMLDAAYDIVKKYDDFAVRLHSLFALNLQDGVKRIIRESIRLSIVNYLGRAQSFIDVPKNKSDAVSAEEVLRSKIGEIKETTPKFIKLLNILNQDGVGKSFVELRDLLKENALWLLEQVEQMITNLNPYQIQDFSFDWWDGKQGAALVGYSVKDVIDLKNYLNVQRQNLITLLDFAKPVINLLEAQIMNDTDEQSALFLKWKRIVEQIDAYVAKKPGNSLTQLEDFILKDFNRVDLKTIFTVISSKKLDEDTGDFFLNTLTGLRKGMLSRAEVLKRNKGVQNYKKLVSFFNKNLKNRFPFVGSNLKITSMEASPEDLRQFYDLFDQAGGKAKEILDQIYQLGDDVAPMVTFLKKMEAIRNFFGSYFQGNADQDLPSLDFTIDFRANKNRESGGNLIVDWAIKPNEDVVINKNDKQRYGRWQYNQPVEVSFRWPEGDTIPVQLSSDKSQPLLSVEGRKATFRYTGRWALLWMLRLQGAKKTDFSKIKDPNPYMTKFIVPIGDDSKKAIIYNLITIFKPSSNPKSPGTIVSVPPFPHQAPAASDAVMNVLDSPVLITGEVQPTEWVDAIPNDVQEPDLSPKSKTKEKDEENQVLSDKAPSPV